MSANPYMSLERIGAQTQETVGAAIDLARMVFLETIKSKDDLISELRKQLATAQVLKP